MKKLIHSLFILLMLNTSILFGQNYLPLKIGNYWNLQERWDSNKILTHSVKDTLTIRNEKYFKCPMNIGGFFNFEYLRLDTATNILFANYGDTSYPIIDFKENSCDTYYYPVPSLNNPSDTIMGQIVKGGYRNSNTINILFNPDTLCNDDEYYIELKKDVGLTKYYILGGFVDYIFLNAFVDGEFIGPVSNQTISNHLSNKTPNTSIKKALHISKELKNDGSMFQVNGKKTNSLNLSKGLYIDKPIIK